MISQDAPVSGEKVNSPSKYSELHSNNASPWLQPSGHYATASTLGSGENISSPTSSISTMISPGHGISPDSSVGAPHTEGPPPVLSPVRGNMLAEESWGEEIYGGALNEYLAPLPRHNVKVDEDSTVTTQLKGPRALSLQETPEQNSTSGRRVLSSPPPGARSGIPRSTATLGKYKELPVALIPGAPRRSLGEAIKAQRASSASTLRNNTLAVEAKQMKPGPLRPLRTPPASVDSQSNPPKPINKKTHPAVRKVEPPKPKAELGKPAPAIWDINRAVPGHVGDSDILPSHAPPAGYTAPKNKELATMRAQGMPRGTLARSPMGKVVSPNLKKLGSPACSPDRRHTRVSITPSLLSSGAIRQGRGFSPSVSFYNDASFLREDSSSTLLSAATNSSGDIVTLAQGYPGNAASVGFLAGSARLVQVSKNPTDFGAPSVGSASREIASGDAGTVSSRGPGDTSMEHGLPVSETTEKETDKTAIANPELSGNPARPRAREFNRGYGAPGCDAMPRGAAATKADARKLSNGAKVIKFSPENKEAIGDERLKAVSMTKASNSSPPTTRHQTARGAVLLGRRKDATTGAGKEPSGDKGLGSAAGKYHRRTSSNGSGGTTKSSSPLRTVVSYATVTPPSRLRRSNATPSIIPQDRATSDVANSSGDDYLRTVPGAKFKARTAPQPVRVTTTLLENIKPHPTLVTIKRGVSRSAGQSFGNKAVSKVLEERHFNRVNPPISQSTRSPKPGNDAGFKSYAVAPGSESASPIANAEPLVSLANKTAEDISPSPKAGAKNSAAKDRVTMSEGAQKVPAIVIRSPEMITQATRNVLGDLSSICCSGRNPEAILNSGRWFGRRSLTSVFSGEGNPLSGESKKANYLVQADSRLTPRKSNKAKSMSLMNIAGWLHKSPKAAHDGLFTKRIKKEKIGDPTLLSSTSPSHDGVSAPVLPPLASSRPISLGFTIHPANRDEHKREFPNEEVDVLIKRLSAQLPQTPDEINGFNALGGRYYTEDYTPNLDVSPSKEGNPIAVCMNLIDAAIKEPQSPRRERLLQMSSILVDAVSKSRDAECAAEEAKMAATRAKCAFLETRKHLQELTDLMAARRGAAGGGG